MSKSNSPSEEKNNILFVIFLILGICTLYGIAKDHSAASAENSKIPNTSESISTSLWTGEKLTASKGTIQGPSGKETFYNMDMSFVIEIMHANDVEGKYNNYSYWIRDDGCKMFGNYIMIAADLRFRPKGTIVDTSLGKGIVVDTGGFIYMYTYYDEETGENIVVPSYVTDPKNSNERIYDPESYYPDETQTYPLSYQLDIATNWGPQR